MKFLNRKNKIEPMIRAKRAGTVLIMVLTVISAITAISFALTFKARVQMQLSENYINSVKCYHIALGAAERLKALLMSKPLDSLTVKTISGFKRDAHEESLLSQKGILSYSIVDESSMLSLNSSDPQMWLKYASVDQSIAQPVLDWSDEDDFTDSYGAENDYYSQTLPAYKCKNKKYENLRELLYVKGIDWHKYCSATEPENAPLIEIFSDNEHLKLNINTTPVETLSKLEGLSANAVYLIEDYLSIEGNCLKTENDYSNIYGLTSYDIELLTQYCKFGSNSFRIYIEAQVEDAVCHMMISIKVVGNKKIEIASVERLR